MTDKFDHLTHISDPKELVLYDLIPNAVWVFDLDYHGWWWGNEAALKFWGLDTVEGLIAKDLSGDTQGARDRTEQTFEVALRDGLSVDPWTTYPGGKPKTLLMMHRAVLVGPERHRAIIAYINDQVDLGSQPENLLLVEAMRYTTVLVTSYSLNGDPIIENPAATAAYKHIVAGDLPEGRSVFESRFVNPEDGKECWERALEEKGGRWEYLMRTGDGVRSHTLDIRMTRHPLLGDYLLLVVEYDVTPLHEALKAAEEAQDKLHHLANYDALTNLPNLRLVRENSTLLLAQAERVKQQLFVMFIDLDGFKVVNDTYGHEAGDQVLKEVAVRLLSILRKSDLASRIGGDEFVIMQSGIEDPTVAATVARKVIDELSRPFVIDGGIAEIGASIGIAFYPEHGNNLDALLKAADQSMYKIKKSGKNNFGFA